METDCISCKKYTANENSNVRKTKQYRLCCLWQENINIYKK